MNLNRSARVAVTAALGLALTVPMPLSAFADTPAELQEQLDAANKKLSAIYAKAGEASEALNETQDKLDQTEAAIDQAEQEIEEKQAQLERGQATLASHASSDYKTGGGASLLQLIFGSTSFSDLVTRVTYANKVARSEATAIENVRDLQVQIRRTKSELEDQKAEQEKLLDSQKEQTRELAAQAKSAEDYVNSLDSQVQQALEAEREAARKAAEEQAERDRQAALEQAAREEAARQQEQANKGNGNSSNNGGSSSNNKDNGGSSAPVVQDVSAARQAILNAAYSMMGGNYVWAAMSPSTRTFDCSGFTKWCYSQAGVSIPRSSSTQAPYCTKPVSQAVPGDILWMPGHVGIYVGNGRSIEAMDPAHGICYGDASRFSRCGSPLGN